MRTLILQKNSRAFKSTLLGIIFIVSLCSKLYAGVALVSNEIHISGVATTDEFQASGGITWNNSSRVYEINYNIRLLSGADVRGINDLIIDIKAHRVYVDTGVVSAEFTDLTFMNSVGRIVTEREWVFDNGGGYISFKNCSYIHNVEGNPGGADPRYADVVTIEDLSNSTIKSSEFTEQEVDVFFSKPRRIKNGVFKNVGRLIVGIAGSNVFFINPTLSSNIINGGFIGVYSGASTMLLNFFPDKLPAAVNIDNYNGQLNDHWIYWLGSSVDNFNRDSNSNSLNIRNRKDELRNIGGGIRYYKFIGAQGATVNVFDSFAGGKAPFLVDLTRADMLNTTLDYTLPVSENVEIVTRAFRYGGDTNWVYTPITGQKIAITKYEKELTVIDVSNDPTNVVGNDEGYVPVLVDDDTNLTELNKSTVDAYTTIDNLDQLYDRAKSYLLDNYAGETTLLATANGSTLDLGNYNLVVDATASSAFAVNTGTITIKSSTFVSGNKFVSVITTGTISTTNGEIIEMGYKDSSGTYVYVKLSNLDQQDVLVTDQQNPASPVTILSQSNLSGDYKTHFQLPTNGVINVLVERDGYAPWTETVPDGDLTFVREVNTSLTTITAENQIKTIDLLTKLLQKSEAILNATNNQSLPIPSVSVSISTTAISSGPSVDNQNTELAILRRILAKMTAARETIQN